MTPHPSRSDAGFSLPEVMVSMGIMLVVLAGTFSAMTNAMQAEQTARGIWRRLATFENPSEGGPESRQPKK